MPMHAPSIRKSKKQLLDRTSKSSSSPTLPSVLGPISEDNPEVVGLDAPKEPIWHSVPEAPSMITHHSNKTLKEKE